MATPQMMPSPIPQVVIPDLCRMTASAAGLPKSWGSQEARAALVGIGNLYNGYLLRQNQVSLHTATTSGFASPEVQRAEILTEIGYCTGASEGRAEAILAGLSGALGQLFVQHGWSHAEIRGIGIFTAVDTARGEYTLDCQPTLARFLRPPADAASMAQL
ncbi:MAG: hypothetical protein IT162_20790 [Bryobacterales bacterium]|nr:hypothetical protein [Bryobacterales bacterium]